MSNSHVHPFRRPSQLIRSFRAVPVLLLLSSAALSACAAAPRPAASVPDPGVVHVAAPTGVRDADRASILAALEQVQPGGTVQFAAGAYIVGRLIRIATPGITLLGHPDRTTLRGCEASRFDEVGRDMAATWLRELGPGESLASVEGCDIFELTGGRATVRGLTFEHAWSGLLLGCCETELQVWPTDGGYLIEDNLFRNIMNGVRGTLWAPEPTVIRRNRFVNTFHAVAWWGSRLHMLDNHISVPEPARLSVIGFPAIAIGVLGGTPPWPPNLPVAGYTGAVPCDDNVIGGNHVEGHPDGINIIAFPGTSCRHNVIRDNTVITSTPSFDRSRPSGRSFGADDTAPSIITGVPLSLVTIPDPDGRSGGVEESVVEGNRVTGAHGVAIELVRASGNRIANNTITGIRSRDPFPGNVVGNVPEWADANGSGIWVSPGSYQNEISGNIFADIAGAAVYIEGGRNRVDTRSPSDAVRDLGRGNRVSGPGAPDTARYTVMPGGIPRGERLAWLEESNILRYAMLFGPPGAPNRRRLESSVELNAGGIPIRTEVRGFQPHGEPWDERFEQRGDTAVWSMPGEQGSRVIAGPAYYPPLLAGPMYHPWPAFGAYDPGLLARALLRRPDRSLPLLPDGEARLEAVERRSVEMNGRTRTVALYAIHGLDLAPAYVWLDESGAFFADRVSIAAGWEPVYRELTQASRAALVEHARERLAGSIVPPRERPLVIRGARLFDPTTRSVRDGTTIVVEGRRIAAVGSDGSVTVPIASEVIDAAGHMALPGLWDMHVHFQPGWSEELSAPLFIAAGVTTTRDLGGETDLVLSLRQRTETGEAVGPRILPALIMYGPGEHALGAGVGTPEEARQAVDRSAALGYVQVKLYNPVPADLVPVIVERARHHGLRVSGHIPTGLTGEEAIQGGFDEFQHLLYARVAAAGIRSLATDPAVGSRLAAVRVGSDEWESFVRLLHARGTVIDATLAVVEESVGRYPAAWLSPVLDRFPTQAARVASRTAGPSAPPPMLREHWDEIIANGPALVRALHEAGVALVIGTDAPIGGFELHREMELFVVAGIPAPDVLQIATLGAARVMGMDAELGSIEPGKLADLILVDGDPTTDIRDIRRVVLVVKDGRVYDPAALYRALGIRPCCEQ